MRMNLAELEVEAGDVEPFELSIDDDTLVLLPHPQEMPFKSIISFDGNDPAGVLRALLGDDAFDKLVSATDEHGRERVTLAVMERVLSAYYDHYGLGSVGEGDASSRSSTGSAGRSKRTSGSRRTGGRS